MSGRYLLLALLESAVMSSACAGHTAPVVSASRGTPSAAWTIRAGTEYGAEREVCRSDRDTSCVLLASTSNRPMNVVVTVFLYPTGEKTTYRGAFLSPFVDSKAGSVETNVDCTIDEGTRPRPVTVAGRLTEMPGDYEFKMALFAEVSGHSDPLQFVYAIPVRVAPGRAVS